MSITAAVVKDSVTVDGHRLTTLELEYPRFIHQEFMTHRAFSRNASSSRAISVTKMVERVRQNPAMPVHWGSNRPGMVAHEEVGPDVMAEARAVWLQASMDATRHAEALTNLGLHKQVANRVLEPFSHIRVLVSATEYTNFMLLRRHPDAQPEMQALANAMYDAIEGSTPAQLLAGQWHLPYVYRDDAEMFGTSLAATWDGVADEPMATLVKLSMARCARVSYRNQQGTIPASDHDLVLANRLLGSTPKHASPAEHQATPVVEGQPYRLSNFNGWVQYRQFAEAA